MWLVALLVALFVSWDLARYVKHHPVIFYGLGVIASVLCIAGTYLGFSNFAWDVFYQLFGTGLVPFFLFAVVMFTGTFKVGSPARIRLKQVRQPVALLACVLTAGHIVAAMVSPHLQMSDFPIVFVAMNVVLFVLLLVLGTTSVLRVTDVMPFTLWQTVHKSAYVFFVLLCIHSAWANASLSWMYLFVGGLYIALRLRAATRRT